MITWFTGRRSAIHNSKWAVSLYCCAVNLITISPNYYSPCTASMLLQCLLHSLFLGHSVQNWISMTDRLLLSRFSPSPQNGSTLLQRPKTSGEINICLGFALVAVSHCIGDPASCPLYPYVWSIWSLTFKLSRLFWQKKPQLQIGGCGAYLKYAAECTLYSLTAEELVWNHFKGFPLSKRIFVDVFFFLSKTGS